MMQSYLTRCEHKLLVKQVKSIRKIHFSISLLIYSPPPSLSVSGLFNGGGALYVEHHWVNLVYGSLSQLFSQRMSKIRTTFDLQWSVAMCQ